MKLLKNKKVLIGVSGIFVIILGICICFYISKDNSDNEMYTSNIEDEKENSVGGFLTLMPVSYTHLTPPTT